MGNCNESRKSTRVLTHEIPFRGDVYTDINLLQKRLRSICLGPLPEEKDEKEENGKEQAKIKEEETEEGMHVKLFMKKENMGSLASKLELTFWYEKYLQLCKKNNRKVDEDLKKMCMEFLAE